jgi:hypothetical protein
MRTGHHLIEDVVKKMMIVTSHHVHHDLHVDDADSPNNLVDARRKLDVTFAK